MLAFFGFSSLTTVDLFMAERRLVVREVRGEISSELRGRPRGRWEFREITRVGACRPGRKGMGTRGRRRCRPPACPRRCARVAAAGGYYRPWAYLLAKAVLDALLLRVVPVFLYAAPFYPMVSAVISIYLASARPASARPAEPPFNPACSPLLRPRRRRTYGMGCEEGGGTGAEPPPPPSHTHTHTPQPPLLRSADGPAERVTAGGDVPVCDDHLCAGGRRAITYRHSG